MSDVDPPGRSRKLRDLVSDWAAAAAHVAEQVPGFTTMRQALEREHRAAGGLLAGGVAFRVFLWLVPLGLVVAASLSLWSSYDPSALQRSARSLGMSAAAAAAAAEALEQSEHNVVVILAFGLVMLAWFTVGVARALMLSHAIAWRLDPPRVRSPLRAVAAVNGFFLLAALASAGVAWEREQLGDSWVLGWLLGVVAMTVIVSLAIWLLPHRAGSVRDLLPGAALIVVGHQAVNVAVIVYFAPRLGRAQETYGAFGAAATMLLWLYVLSRLITVSAFLNATIHEQRHPEASSSRRRDVARP